MGNSVTGSFGTRRDAEMAVERLVQEFGVERSDIFIAAEGAENSAGVEVDGSDCSTIPSAEESRDDGPHAGAVKVSVDVNESAAVNKIVSAFDEFDGAADVRK